MFVRLQNITLDDNVFVFVCMLACLGTHKTHSHKQLCCNHYLCAPCVMNPLFFVCFFVFFIFFLFFLSTFSILSHHHMQIDSLNTTDKKKKKKRNTYNLNNCKVFVCLYVCLHVCTNYGHVSLVKLAQFW